LRKIITSPHKTEAEGLSKALDRLFYLHLSPKKCRHEMNRFTVNLHMMSAASRLQSHRFSNENAIPDIRADFLGFTVKSVLV